MARSLVVCHGGKVTRLLEDFSEGQRGARVACSLGGKDLEWLTCTATT